MYLIFFRYACSCLGTCLCVCVCVRVCMHEGGFYEKRRRRRYRKSLLTCLLYPAACVREFSSVQQTNTADTEVVRRERYLCVCVSGWLVSRSRCAVCSRSVAHMCFTRKYIYANAAAVAAVGVTVKLVRLRYSGAYSDVKLFGRRIHTHKKNTHV